MNVNMLESVIKQSSVEINELQEEFISPKLQRPRKDQRSLWSLFVL